MSTRVFRVAAGTCLAGATLRRVAREEFVFVAAKRGLRPRSPRYNPDRINELPRA
jgi:hypothetical protein